MKKAAVILMVILFSSLAFAAGGSVSSRRPVRSVEALGMGEAFYTKSDNKFAPFYNPAGLARIAKWRADIIPLTVEVGQNILEFTNDLNAMSNDNNTDGNDNDDVESAKLLIEYMNKPLYIGANILHGFTKKNFTLGVYAGVMGVAYLPYTDLGGLTTDKLDALAALDPNNITQADLDNIGIDITLSGNTLEDVLDQIEPLNNMSLEFEYEIQIGVVVGVARSFMEDKLQIGLAPRYANVTKDHKIYSYKTVDDFGGDSKKGEEDDEIDTQVKGKVLMADFGMIYNFYNDGINPRVGMAVNNIKVMDSDHIDPEPLSLNVSAGISPSYGVLSSDIILDITDVTSNVNSDLEWGKRVNLGAELQVFKRIAFRTGLHEGYFTYGMGLDLALLRLNYAHYYEDMQFGSNTIKDERHAIEVVIGF